MLAHLLVLFLHDEVGIEALGLLSLLWKCIHDRWPRLRHLVLLLLSTTSSTTRVFTTRSHGNWLALSKVTSSPITNDLFGSLVRGTSRSLLDLLLLLRGCIHLVLECSGLIGPNLFVLLLVASIELPWSLVSGTSTHLLTHHLSECVVATTWKDEHLFRLLLLLDGGKFLEASDVWLPVERLGSWLPFGEMELCEWHTVFEDTCASTGEERDGVVNLHKMVEDACMHEESIGCPLDTDGALRFG